jgi:hypothetical protein
MHSNNDFYQAIFQSSRDSCCFDCCCEKYTMTIQGKSNYARVICKYRLEDGCMEKKKIENIKFAEVVGGVAKGAERLKEKNSNTVLKNQTQGEPPQKSDIPTAIESIETNGGKIFIASSIEEFKKERRMIAGTLDAINPDYNIFLAEIHVDGDNQVVINKHISESEYFVAIIGRRLGRKTLDEIMYAIKQNKEFGTPMIKIFVQKFGDNDRERTPEVKAFDKELYEEGEYYPTNFADSDELIDQVELYFRRKVK